MKKTILKNAIAFALLGGMATAATHAADVIEFDPDGVGGANGTTEVVSFDWAVGATLSDQAIPTAPGSDINTYAHAALTGYADANGDPAGAPIGINTNFEITFIAGFSESISTVTSTAKIISGDGVSAGSIVEATQTITLEDPTVSSVNFFTMYYDDTINDGTKANSVTGLGYDDGIAILQAEVNFVSGNFSATFQYEEDGQNVGYQPGEDTIVFTSLAQLDQSGDNNWPGTLTVTGNGSTTLEGDVDSATLNRDFFISDVSQLTTDMFFNTSNVLPFNQSNPSQSFDSDNTSSGTAGTISLANGLLDVGVANGLQGPDILFQTDSNQSFVLAEEVPVPNTAWLLTLSLVLLGIGRKQQKRA